MLIYFLVLLIPMCAAFTSHKSSNIRRPGLWVYFAILLVFTGLRDEIGPDWTGYLNIYESYENRDLEDVFSIREPGFFLINKVAEYAGWGLHGVMFLSALIFLWGVFAYARTTSNPWLAIAAITPYLIFVVSMSGARQAAAIGVGFLMLSGMKQRSTWRNGALVALATSFHNSAIFFVFFIIFSKQSHFYARCAAALVIAAILAYGFRETAAAEKYVSIYIDENLISGGALFHVLLSAAPSGIYLLNRRRICASVGENRVIDIAAIMALVALPLLAVSSTGVDRLALYLSFTQMWIYPAIVRTFASSKLFHAGIAMLILSVFLVYFFFGTHANAYIPYSNLLNL